MAPKKEEKKEDKKDKKRDSKQGSESKGNENDWSVVLRNTMELLFKFNNIF